MRKNVLIISSSPRKGGNSETLAASFAKGAQDGSEDRVRSMIPNGLPEDVRKAYENAHHD